jgi:murein DD-endopeptidase MepM/ murein hydrolase activator NlpD
VRVAAVAAVAGVLGLAAVPGAALGAPPPTRPQAVPVVPYAPPVDAPVIDGFRVPATPYGAGNRGWEYATPGGATVRAAADGTVTFAGQVGAAYAVTVRHADGARTSYSQLAEVLVDAGTEVQQGQAVGRSTDRLHFGVRRGDVYVDPATLFAPVRGRARLVPLRRARPLARRTPAGPSAPATLARRPPCRRSPTRPQAVRQNTRSRP